MSFSVVGIRHHSPACARLVARTVLQERPAAVLIEGPSDFNGRLDELTLPHTLPIALYSYLRDARGAAQCWFPFLDYSPEWVALGAARQVGATTAFIDLPHWRYRTAAAGRAERGESAGRDRYALASDALCRRFACDGDDILWDRLFESAPSDALAERLDAYFAGLRGDDPGSAEDRAREEFMARHIAAAVARAGEGKVLVVCGGWHRRALEARAAALLAAGDCLAPEAPEVPAGAAAGSYLVPYEFRQAESLAGYGAGMQSPLFYQWCWQGDAAEAMERAMRAVVERLRARRASLATADFVAFRSTVTALARLRGNEPPNRADLLDGVLTALVKEALERPPPWSQRGLLGAGDHPVLREALLALTGDVEGRLDAATPQPPLLRDVEAILARLDLAPDAQAREVRLDRREATDQPRAEALWRLHLLNISGVELKAVGAVRGGRHLPEALRYQEHWRLDRRGRWHADLIEASRFGPTLADAAENALRERLGAAAGDAKAVAQCLVLALRAGFGQLGDDLLAQLDNSLPAMHEHGVLAGAGLSLLELARTGFWGRDALSLLRRPLAAIGERLLWLLDERRSQAAAAMDADVDAVAFVVGLLEFDLPAFDRDFALDALARYARRADAPHALRGAALGAGHKLGLATQDQVLAVTRAIPPRDGLGEFLFGLFAQTRELASQDSAVVEAIQGALDAMPQEDFLVALPHLRGAFAWFPPRERGQVAARVAEVLGLTRGEQLKLLRLPADVGDVVDAKRVEAQALAWAQELGILP